MKKILAADLFCGAGGASTGFVRACDELGLDYELLAINHWPTAVETHSANHPNVRHLCESVERVDPREAVPGGRLHLLLAGPECTHFSTARGGRPVNPQSRASAWHILKWAQELYIDTILIENVPEFRTWGPVNADGRPSKRQKGQTYRAFLDALRSLGYRVEDRVLVSADYGDPTTRKRLFIMARRGKHQIRWPNPTHSKAGGATLFGQTKRWRAAREVIDWSVAGKSIFHRKKPLKPATIARILAGLEKFGGPDLKPFLVILRRNQAGMSVDAPVPTITTSGAHVGLAQPFLMHITHAGAEDRTRSVDDPLPTITTAKRGEIGVVESFVLPQHGGGALRPVDEPLPTIATDGAIAVVEPFIVDAAFGRRDDMRRTSSVDAPVGTIPGSNRFALAQPFIVPPLRFDPNRTVSVDDPLPTITATGGRLFGLAEPFLVPMYGERQGQDPRTHSVEEPVPTIPATGSGKFGVVEPFIVANNTNNAPRSVDEPVPTITTGARNYLAEPFILQQQSNGAPRCTDDPLPTITAAGKQALVEPFLTKYNRTATGAYSVEEPLDTISTRDRFGLVQPVIDGYVLDIHFRMLQPHELAAATSFPKSYVFRGSREDVVKQIGNSWTGELAFQLNRAALAHLAPSRRRRPAWRDEATA